MAQLLSSCRKRHLQSLRRLCEIRYYEGTNPVGGTELIYSLDVDEEATVVNLSKLGLEKTSYKLAENEANGIIKTEGKKFYAEVYVQEK